MKKPQPSQAINTESKNPGSILLSLIIPCYNESARIDMMLQGLAEFNEKWPGKYEAIIVDDGSKDDTATKTKQAVDSKYPQLKDKVHIEVLPKNAGKGGALKKGVSLAKGDYVLTLDADMSTKPVELLNWLKKDKGLFNGDHTIYIGSRKHEDGKVEALQSRRIIGGVFNSIVQVFTSLQLKDTQCGFKLYPGHVASWLFGGMHSTGWAHDVELLYQADLNGIAIVEMPINWVNQPESKVNVIKDSFLMLIGVLSISMRLWFYNSFIMPFRIPATATPEEKKYIVSRSVFNLLALLLIIIMPAMSFQFAITGDEHWHFDYGNSIYNYFFGNDTSAQTGIAPGAVKASGIQYYGGIFDFITATFYHKVHIWDHYTTMHFFNALVGAIGIIYAGKLARLLGGWGAAILTLVFLVLSPSWFGHNFANPKDIPFSVGYTAGIYFILLFLKSLPHPNAKHIFGLVCSIGWAMGVRIGGFLLIAYLGLFLFAYSFLTGQLKAVLNKKLITQMVIVGVLGYLIAILFWPYAHQGIISMPLEALKVMSNFFVNIGLIFDGKRILSNQVPWYYIPKYILYTAPVIVLVGVGICVITIPAFFRKNKTNLIFAYLVIFAIVFPLAYAIYKNSSLYDGWRHFLFIYPPLVVLAAVGLNILLGMKQKAVGYAVLLVVVIGLVLPAKFVMANHPFESLYFNEISGGMKNIYGKYETDYYMLGVKPAIEWLYKNEHIEGNKKVIVTTNCIYPLQAYVYQAHYKTLPAKYDIIYERFADFRHDSTYESYKKLYPDFVDNYNVGVDYVGYAKRYDKDWDYCILFSRFVEPAQLISGNWPPPETIHTIDVDGVPVAAILKRKTRKDFEGLQLLKAKKYEEAKGAFLASLVEYPNNDVVWEKLASMYNTEGKIDSMLMACQKVIARDPGNVTMYEMAGQGLIKSGKIDSAIAFYKNLAKYNLCYSHYFIGYANAVKGNINGAYNEIEQAIEADPTNSAPYNLGINIARQTKNNGKVQEYTERKQRAISDDDE